MAVKMWKYECNVIAVSNVATFKYVAKIKLIIYATLTKKQAMHQ